MTKWLRFTKIHKHFSRKLEQVFFKKGSFLHPTVLQMSQQLDEYIVMFEKIRY
ncbi:aspartyl-phosphate phosphatase Spo0E family protein [Brevibacillus laterosporus]|uniref:Aspartyl-phosphate phosphatase Spo0E family protein n=1 Tax=Brevibacillus laterosporus TaxID=1465 RepID=A0AAP8U535_BRELA|nr:aspartyl-phosphate phosphatase Spo0E family protein [Brevibacillus laterosporus]PPA87261.1 aspartyl-phosphate phosphatase Spo0E family protein [Brevibacillus laterosporus]PPB02184.1 aspartyl-phosphate phosphatase Spo0E family protein [Brevibacillus laterosporus]